MILTALGLVVGFVLLVKGGDLLVDGASWLARRWGVSLLVIGLTVVAFGTSAPELVVNIVASARGQAELAIGNAVGSNTMNILLVLGLTAIFIELRVQQQTVWKEIPLATLAMVVLLVMVSDASLDGIGENLLSRGDGVILLAFFTIFVAYTFFVSRREGREGPEIEQITQVRSWFYVSLGLVGLWAGGQLVVNGATEIARLFRVSEAVIGLTIVAIGTSAPELVTAIVAARKRKPDLAVGSIVGSNLFNTFFVLGTSASIRPLPVGDTIRVDVLVALVASMLLLATAFFDRHRRIRRSEGATFVLLYALYVVFLIFREAAR